MGIAHTMLENKWRSLIAFMRMDSEMQGRWETHKRIGSAYMWLGLWEMALPRLVEALGVQEGQFSFVPEQRDDCQTWDFIGQCFFNMNQFEKAKVAWKRCVELSKDKTGNSDFFSRMKVLEQLIKDF
jgi:tetratricopeptide (TPR) repeat protein